MGKGSEDCEERVKESHNAPFHPGTAPSESTTMRTMQADVERKTGRLSVTDFPGVIKLVFKLPLLMVVAKFM